MSLFKKLTLLSGNDGLRINLLAGYDPWQEIAEASKRSQGDIRLEDLWVKTKVDAVIGSGGAALLSGFLPLQCQYAHIFSTNKLFNDLSDVDFNELIFAASSIQHQFGK